MNNNSLPSTVSSKTYTALGLSYDYDGCMIHDGYHTIDEFSVLSPARLATDKKIIESNQALWDYVRALLTKHPTIQIIRVYAFSLRQDYCTNRKNSQDKSTECYFRALRKIAAHLTTLFPDLDIELVTTLIPDIKNSLTPGASFKYAEENDYEVTDVNEMTEDDLLHHMLNIGLKSKRDLVMMHNNFAFSELDEHEILMVYFDDLREIVLDTNIATYSSPAGLNAFPKTVSSTFCHYKEGVLTELTTLHFTGKFNPLYAQQLRLLWKTNSEAEFEKTLSNQLSVSKPRHYLFHDRKKSADLETLTGAQSTSSTHSTLSVPSSSQAPTNTSPRMGLALILEDDQS